LSRVATDGKAQADVEIRLGSLPPLAQPIDYLDAHIAFGPREILIDPLEAARFAVRDGREIIVSPYPGANESGIRVYLLDRSSGRFAISAA